MLTRLRVSGFKNLLNVDVRFGPFTCIAGANGVGKSNLFDAIRFLGALASQPLMEAAATVRPEGARSGDVRSLFLRCGDYGHDRMSLVADMIVPRTAKDDLGKEGIAANTFLRYSLELGIRAVGGPPGGEELEITKESLEYLQKGEAAKELGFAHSQEWRDLVIFARRRGPPFVSTDDDGMERVIRRHQDGKAGRPLVWAASALPRTVLSVANAAESPTALCARREMESWRLLQLEPAAIRQPDHLNAPTLLAVNGEHLPATLYRLAYPRTTSETNGSAEAVFARVANRLAELIGGVRGVQVERDDKRELLVLQLEGQDGTLHSARALSGGTLRFLALAVLELDTVHPGVFCLEEPENGIHPARIPAILRLLRELAVDPSEPADDSNVLRQVIVNTHSPRVVAEVKEDSLLMAEGYEQVVAGRPFTGVQVSCLSETWRTRVVPVSPTTSRGTIVSYLSPDYSAAAPAGPTPAGRAGARRRVVRVCDRPELQPLLLGWDTTRDG